MFTPSPSSPTESPVGGTNQDRATSGTRVQNAPTVYHEIEHIHLFIGALYPHEHNRKNRTHCRDCKATIQPGQGAKVYTWTGWTSFTLCQACARERVESTMFYWNGALRSWAFTLDVYQAEISGNHLAEIIWGAK